MSYWVDRAGAFRGSEIVAALSVRRRGVRCRIVWGDDSAYDTLTRPVTVRRQVRAFVAMCEGVVWPSAHQNPRG